MRTASTAIVEAVRRRARRQHRHRRLAVAAEQRLQQVGLFGLGGQTRRRAAALHVDDQQRQLGHHGQPERLGLQRHARARRAGDAERAAVGGADRGADAADLVLGLEGDDVEVLVLGQLVQDVRRRRDRVAAEHDLDVGQLAGRDDAVRQRGVARDLPVFAGRQLRRRHLVGGARTPRWSRRSSSPPSAPARSPRRCRACGRTSPG